MSLSKNYDRAFFNGQRDASIRSAERVLDAISPLLAGLRSAIDIGCGAGGWLDVLSNLRPDMDIHGVDHPNIPRESLFIEAHRFHGADLTKPLAIDRRFDLTMSLEVAEHLDEAHAEAFIGNLTRFSDLVLFSAAPPRQGGTHHVNEQWPAYWVEKFAAEGFNVHDVVRPLIWDMSDVRGWYKQNCLMFARPSHGARFVGYQDWNARPMIHPDVWMNKTEPFYDTVKRVLGRRERHSD